MKKNFLKIISLLLVIATLSLMVSCDLSSMLEDIAPEDLGNGHENGATGEIKFTLEATEPSKDIEENTEEETEAETEKETSEYGEPIFTPSIPTNELDFEGEMLTVMLRDNEITKRQWYKESPEDVLDEAVAKRNASVEEALNLQIIYDIIPYGQFDVGTVNYNNIIITDVNNDLHYYDIVDHWALAGGYMSIRDYHANLLDQDIFPYFDFDLPCWNQSVCNGNGVVNNRLHLITGALNTTQFDMAAVFWYNKSLYDHVKEPSDHDDIQDLALAGQWTYDELFRWSQRLYENTNGEEGRQTDDIYGFATQSANLNTQPIPKDAISAAFDIDLLTTNPDGTHSYNIVGNNKIERAREMWIDIFKQPGTIDGGSAENFANGHYLFWASTIYSGKQDNIAIRQMADKYGILPMPKYDRYQDKYYTSSFDSYSLMSVLDHSNSSIPIKGEAVSAFLQLTAEESYTYIRDAYFDTIIKPKFFATDDTEGTISKSRELFDIIVDNIRFDFWNVYTAHLNHLLWKFRTSLLEDWDSLEAAYMKEQATFDKALLEVDAWFGLITLDE